MSTPGPERNPSSVKVNKTSGQGKPPAAGGSKPGGAKKTTPGAKKATPGAKGGGKGRKPVAPVKVTGSSKGPIITGSVVGLVVLVMLGFAIYYVVQGSRNWEDQADDIKGVVDYRKQKNPTLESRQHKDGPLTYITSPPVGGDHNGLWQNCMGDIYDQPIANEHAVHSLEHGAVWVTYKPGLAQDQIDALKKKVQGKDYMLMSPYTGLDKNISLQVWGMQLKVDNASDSRIDKFIKATRVNASVEPTAICSSGNTTTGPVTAATSAGTTPMTKPSGS